MKKCCRVCAWARQITYKDRQKMHIPDDRRLVFCRYNNSVHRKDKEQLKCREFFVGRNDIC